MNWGEILALFLILFRTDVAVIQLAQLGYGPLFTLTLTIGWTLFVTALVYFLTGVLDKKIFEKKGLGKKFSEIPWIKRIRDAQEKREKRWINWLLGRDKLLIRVLIFLVILTPFTPWIEGPTIIATRLAKIKGALLLLLLAGAGKMFLVALFVYII